MARYRKLLTRGDPLETDPRYITDEEREEKLRLRAKQAKGRMRAARAIAAKARILSQPEFKAKMGLTEEDMVVLNAIAMGFAPRNAQSILKAIQMKADYAYEKPAIKPDPAAVATFAAMVAAAGRPETPGSEPRPLEAKPQPPPLPVEPGKLN
jgi:hypothetical protein